MRPRGIPHRRKALFIGLGAVGLILVGAVAGAVVLLSGAYSTAATKQHFGITYRLLELGLHFSVLQHAEGIEAPDLENPAMVRQGLACYRRYCTQCHGAPGVARAEVGRGELPSPSALAQSGREWPAAHLYFVTKKGVRMSGMPAWEFRISDPGLWATVAFLKRMPFLTAESYAELVEASAELDCPQPDEPVPYSTERAQVTLRQYACHNCHLIDDVVGPQTYVGPPLKQWHKRKYIAGTIPNTPENLVRWILEPQAVNPATLMPDLEVTEAHARDMARYLFEHR